MLENVVHLKEYKIEKSYREFAKVSNFGIGYVSTLPKKKRNIRKELIEGYMKLLTQQIERGK